MKERSSDATIYEWRLPTFNSRKILTGTDISQENLIPNTGEQIKSEESWTKGRAMTTKYRIRHRVVGYDPDTEELVFSKGIPDKVLDLF